MHACMSTNEAKVRALHTFRCNLILQKCIPPGEDDGDGDEDDNDDGDGGDAEMPFTRISVTELGPRSGKWNKAAVTSLRWIQME